jgi:hypothetical protein
MGYYQPGKSHEIHGFKVMGVKFLGQSKGIVIKGVD